MKVDIAGANDIMAMIEISPASSLMDQKVAITVVGLQANQCVTLRAHLVSDRGKIFHSHAFYIANEFGSVRVVSDPSVGGDYTGIEPMGLLWSMKQAGSRTGAQSNIFRLVKLDVTKPYCISIEALDGHIGVEENGRLLSVEQFEKWYMASGVQRIPVKEGNIRGTLFLPPGFGPFAGIIDLFGGTGGLVEFRASLLASHGFAALALAYFGFDDLPSTVEGIDLKYFHEAIDWMLALPKVCRSGLGMVGVSKGSELVLTLAIQRTEITAVVALSPAFAIMSNSLKYNGLQSDFIPLRQDWLSADSDGAIHLVDFYVYEEADQPGCTAVIPVENIQCPLLLVYGTDDQCWNAEYMTERIASRMAAHGKAAQCEVLRYPNAGHLIEPPYTPLCKASYTKLCNRTFAWGGETKAHATAQEESWNKILAFLDKNLKVASSKSSASKL